MARPKKELKSKEPKVYRDRAKAETAYKAAVRAKQVWGKGAEDVAEIGVDAWLERKGARIAAPEELPDIESYIKEAKPTEPDTRKPVKVRSKKEKLNVAKVSMVTMLSSSCAMLCTTVSLALKQEFWVLETDEAEALGKAIDAALDTLPEKYYEIISTAITNWSPWYSLAFVAGAVFYPRIDESRNRFKTRNLRANQNRNGRESGPGPAAPVSDFNNWTGIEQSL